MTIGIQQTQKNNYIKYFHNTKAVRIRGETKWDSYTEFWMDMSKTKSI